MKLKLAPTLLFVFIQTVVFSQSTGDYRSTKSGLWTDVTSWQYYNGTAWVTPSASSPQGYPGQYAFMAGAVLIQGGDVISVGLTGISTELIGILTISGELYFLGDTSGVNSTIKTILIIVSPTTGIIKMINKVTLYVPVENAVIQASTGGLNGGNCSNNQTIILGILPNLVTIDCSGSLKYSYVSGDGGTPNAIPTSNTPVCQGNAIDLFGAYSGLGQNNTVTYSWTILDPNNNAVTAGGTITNPIIANPIVGTYKATLNCSTTYSSNTYYNSETINVVVNPTPLVPIVGIIKPIDCNSAGSVVLSGLPTGSWVINPGNIVGSGTSTIITGLAVESYAFTVMNHFGCVSSATSVGSIVITDKSSSTWNGDWSNGIPSITTNVVLASNYDTTLQPNITACSLTINNGVLLTVKDGKFVTIQNNLIVATAATLNIANQGSLVMISDAGTVTNNGTINVNKTTTPFEKFDYTYWSSPITRTPISYTAGTTFANWRSDHAYYFNPANFLDSNDDGYDDDQNDWMGAANMDVPGLGYIIMGATWLSSYPAVESVVFTANVLTNKLNTGSINVPISLTPGTITDDDWNLLGNPYPCAIDATAFLNANSAKIDATLYFWTHKANLGGELNLGPDAQNFSQSDYAMYNLSGGTGTSATVSTTGSSDAPVNSKPQGYIASGQGFFVEANVNGSVIFNNSMRVGDAVIAPNTQFYKILPVKESNKTKDRLWLNLENSDGMFSQQLLGYFENTTDEVDNGYDGLLSDGGNYINFYSLINKGAYKIQGRESFTNEDQVPLGYFSAIAGTFNINIDSKEGVFNTEDNAVILEDKLLGILHNLKDSPYSFDTESGTFEDRFVLSYSSKTLATDHFEFVEKGVLVAVKNKAIKISSSLEIIDKVFIFDFSGKLVYSRRNINDKEIKVTELTLGHSQALIVKVILQNGQVVAEKIIL